MLSLLPLTRRALGDLLDGPPRLDRLGLGAPRVAARVGLLVAALDDQPLGLVATAGALKRPAADQLLALQPDLDVTGLQRLGHRVLVIEGPVGAHVPYEHGPGPVALAEHALEVEVVKAVILDLDREPLLTE